MVRVDYVAVKRVSLRFDLLLFGNSAANADIYPAHNKVSRYLPLSILIFSHSPLSHPPFSIVS
jgi:hypothetical protein